MDRNVETVNPQTEIMALYQQWLAAVRKKDVNAIVACYTDDVLAFDAIMALQFKGKQAYRDHWQQCMDFCPAGDKEMIFELHQLNVQAHGDTAYSHALTRCGFKEGEKIDASWMRMSSGLRRENGQWKIAHEHFSAPVEMPSGKAMFYLTPDEAPGVRPVPQGMSTVTPHLVCKDARAAMDFYRRAFGAMDMPQGTLELDGAFLHGELMIGDSVVMIAEENEQCGSVSPSTLKNTPVSLHLYFPDVDQAFQKAVKAGAKVMLEPTEMFWGDRFAVVEDPDGHRWSLATHVRDLTPEQVNQEAREFMAQMAQMAK